MTNDPLRISACAVVAGYKISLKLHNLIDYATSSQKPARNGMERSLGGHKFKKQFTVSVGIRKCPARLFVCWQVRIRVLRGRSVVEGWGWRTL